MIGRKEADGFCMNDEQVRLVEAVPDISYLLSMVRPAMRERSPIVCALRVRR